MDTKRMRACVDMLEEPGRGVVVQCLDEIERLLAKHAVLESDFQNQRETAGTMITHRDDTIKRLRANSVARCEWIEDENGTWETECGNAFEIIEGTPAENHFKFCTYCGGALVELPYRALEDVSIPLNSGLRFYRIPRKHCRPE